MKTTNIAPYIKELLIFDDPEYCKTCTFQKNAAYYECVLFKFSLSPNNEGEVEKCPQCKEAWLKAHGEAHTGCVLDIGPNDIPQECVIDTPEYTKHDCNYSDKDMTKNNCGYWKTVNIKH